MENSRLYVPLLFMRAYGLQNLGEITLIGRNGTKKVVKVLGHGTGRRSLGEGWKPFAKANGLQIGARFILELIREDGTPMFRLNKTKKARNIMEERGGSSSLPIHNRFVKSVLTPKDVRDCILHLPTQFMKANGIDKPGKIIIWGKSKMNWCGFLSKDGILAVGVGWKGFCDANGVKPGDSFTLEFIGEQDTNPVFKFC